MLAELAEALACLRDSKASVQALRRKVTALKAQNAALHTAGAPRSGTVAALEQQNTTLPSSADTGPDCSTHIAASGCSRNAQAPAACGQAVDNAELHTPADTSGAQLRAWYMECNRRTAELQHMVNELSANRLTAEHLTQDCMQCQHTLRLAGCDAVIAELHRRCEETSSASAL